VPSLLSNTATARSLIAREDANPSLLIRSQVHGESKRRAAPKGRNSSMNATVPHPICPSVSRPGYRTPIFAPAAPPRITKCDYESPLSFADAVVDPGPDALSVRSVESTILGAAARRPETSVRPRTFQRPGHRTSIELAVSVYTMGPKT
jgi:hypothetical protein